MPEFAVCMLGMLKLSKQVLVNANGKCFILCIIVLTQNLTPSRVNPLTYFMFN